MAYTRVPPHLAARLLYPNPVCFLVTAEVGEGGAGSSSVGGAGHNAMVISWLTAVDNAGHFVMSVNAGRHTARNLLPPHAPAAAPTAPAPGGAAAGPPGPPPPPVVFTLSPAVDGMQDMLLRVGGTSGATRGPCGRDKPARLGLPLCRPGGKPEGGGSGSGGSSGVAAGGRPASSGRSKSRGRQRQAAAAAAAGEGEGEGARAVAGAAAHLVCDVQRVLVDGRRGGGGSGAGADLGHHVLLCRIRAAYVAPGYWATGKTFSGAAAAAAAEGGCGGGGGAAAPAPPPVPPLLSFLGSKQFALLQPQALPPVAGGGVDP
jgi:flavin reductase (DIM6/NTAB) family NADH-FMN oxidoreductase RutF